MYMNTDEFMNLSMNEKLKTINKMLEKEDKDHLKNVSAKIGIRYSIFTKIMRDNGNYQYNQTSKRYEKLMSLDDYEKYLQNSTNTAKNTNETLDFLSEHLEDLKNLLLTNQSQLILDTKVYDTSSKTLNKSLQVNADIYKRFTELCATEFPHLRQKDLVSQCLLDFIQKYQKSHSD